MQLLQKVSSVCLGCDHSGFGLLLQGGVCCTYILFCTAAWSACACTSDYSGCVCSWFSASALVVLRLLSAFSGLVLVVFI
jgi:hypothetical protein